MKKYIVKITTTFVKELEVESTSASNAQSIAEKFLDGALDCEPTTTIKAQLKK